ncbi:MAG TPA: three-Cys-motif partner protein TcmP [Tepidisphaeraceae bacterium]|jgi:three-Cys-motif partner protein
MPSKKHGTIWKAEPHTIAKIEMLTAYLNAYFPILAQSKRGKPFLYVDGFAGPGEYTNHPVGSPIAAITAIKTAMSQLGTKWTAGNVTCVFIEPDGPRCEHLRGRIKDLEDHARIKVEVKEKSFENGMAELRQQMPKPFSCDEPLFVFIDPFGATGVPFNVVADILSSDCSEVLINLDADGIARIFAAEDNNNRDDQLTGIFGDESWRSALPAHEAFDMLCRRVLELYKIKLRAIQDVQYVFAFEMQGFNNTLNYHLVFASRNPLGLVKMKEAMKTIDQTGSYTFSDGRIGQDVLFRFDNPADFASNLHKTFVGREVGYPELNRFALNETRFTNPKGMLRLLEDEGGLTVKSLNPKRRRSDFNEETLVSVSFQPIKVKQVQGVLFSGQKE